MGIYDRDYYQDNRNTFLGTLARSGQVCKYLILANVVVFVLQLLTLPRGGAGAGDLGMSGVGQLLILDTAKVLQGEVWRLVTYAFLHAGIMHILFNMLFLWWFGKDVEDLYGPIEFLCFYLVSALVGGLAFQLWAMTGRPADGPAHELPKCLGASGAVTAVLVLCACHFPRRVILIWFVLPVPIWAFVIISVLMDLFVLVGNQPSVVAVSVHLGGAAFGYCYYRLQWRLLNLWPDWNALKRRARRPRLRVYREEDPQTPVSVAAPPNRDVDEHLEAKVDAVLEKVARFGQASLNESERQVLLRASEIYRKKRS